MSRHCVAILCRPEDYETVTGTLSIPRYRTATCIIIITISTSSVVPDFLTVLPSSRTVSFVVHIERSSSSVKIPGEGEDHEDEDDEFAPKAPRILTYDDFMDSLLDPYWDSPPHMTLRSPHENLEFLDGAIIWSHGTGLIIM